jgi:hypothetical protein
MSWHTSGLVVQVETPKESFQAFLQSIGVDGPEYVKTAPFDDAISGDDADMVAIASMDGWTSVWGIAMMWAADDDVMKKLFKNTNAFTFTMEGASDTYLFEWWVKGVRKRKYMIQEGEVGINEGKPLPEENEVFKQEVDDEQRILLLLEKLTLPWKRLTKPKYHVFAVEDPLSEYLGDDDD